jgi:hypothetical protein
LSNLFASLGNSVHELGVGPNQRQQVSAIEAPPALLGHVEHSKKLENLKAAVALHFAHYNFVSDSQDAENHSRDGGWRYGSAMVDGGTDRDRHGRKSGQLNSKEGFIHSALPMLSSGKVGRPRTDIPALIKSVFDLLYLRSLHARHAKSRFGRAPLVGRAAQIKFRLDHYRRFARVTDLPISRS